GHSPYTFFGHVTAGPSIAIVMPALAQDLMQTYLPCRNPDEAQKNMYWLTILLVFVNFLFLTLGAMLYLYAGHEGIAIPDRTDELYPMLAIHHFPIALGIAFILGITAAAYASSDSALAALTTSFCVDFVGFRQ